MSKKLLYGIPTIVASGFLVGFFWSTIYNDLPAGARPGLPSTTEAIQGFKRIRDNMPNMDTFLGIRAVFQKINEQLGGRR